MRFDTPFAFFLLLLLPFALEAGTRRRLTRFIGFRKSQSPAAEISLPFSAPISFAEIAAVSGFFRRDVVLNLLRSLSFILLVTAIARPQTSSEFTEVETSGRDIMLALDLSGSMRALDFILNGEHVDRLTALQAVVSEFVTERKGDRIGLIVFGTDVFTQCPLTADHNILVDFVKRLEIGMVGEGTALGDGIALGVKRIREIPGNSKVIVLLTDGLKTAGAIEPKEAAEIAKKEGIKVYTIGIGGTKPAPFRMRTPFGDTVIQYQNVPVDEDTLKSIADITGGKFFHAEETDALRNVYKEINRLEERTERQTEFVDYHEQFAPFLVAAICLFVLHQILRATRYLVVP